MEDRMHTRQIIPATGLLATILVAAYMVVQLDAQTATRGNFANAAVAEVKDAQGRVVLSGPFQPMAEEDDDVERKAMLTPTGVDPDAEGDAELEFSKAAPAEQEIEFSVRNLAPRGTVTFAIDGVDVGSATADARGRAELEIDITADTGSASR
jgi:hypothetical protein